MTDISIRERILYQASKLTKGDRNKSYGEPVRNMQDIGILWTIYLNGKEYHKQEAFGITGEDVAHMLTLMKIARTYVPTTLTPDSYIDGACYQAIAGECAEAERNDSE